MKAIRWILVFPASFVASYLSYVIVAYAMQAFFTGWWLSPDSFAASFITIVLGSIAMGVFYLYAGLEVAPIRNNILIIAICIVGIVPCLILSIVAFTQEEYWAVLNFTIAGTTCGIIGWDLIDTKIT